MMENRTPSPQAEMPIRNRLPTLFEVLGRQTLPPVDLFSFYIYMRDQQRSVDYLDFWLDVAQHMSLCRHYVRELRRSVMVGTPDGSRTQSKRSSAILNNLGDMNPAAGPTGFNTEKEKDQDAQMSAFLREEAQNGGQNGEGEPFGHSPSHSFGSQGGHRISNASRIPSNLSSPHFHEESPSHTVARADIRASAEKILYTFLLAGAEREIILPDSITSEITVAIEEQFRDDPEVFDAAKDYVYQAMERDAFPGFLRMKALGNLVPPSMMLRLIVGLFCLFAGFWTAFTLIFLDYAHHTRAWVVLPFTIAIYALTSYQYALDPVLALIGYSEYTFMSFSRIREPFVRKLLIKRAFTVLSVFALIDAAIICLFVFVPGKRL